MEGKSIAMDWDKRVGTHDHTPAVLQLHSWDRLAIPLSEFAEAALSPSRELLLLKSRNRDLFLLPLEGCSNACPDPLPLHSPLPDSSFRAHNSLVSATCPLPSSAAGRTSRHVSGISASGSSHPGDLSAYDNVYDKSPSSTPHGPVVNPPSSSHDFQGAPGSDISGSSICIPSRFLCQVDHFAWAFHGDGFGSVGPCGKFKELLFTTTEEGLFINCFLHKHRASGKYGGTAVSSTSGKLNPRNGSHEVVTEDEIGTHRLEGEKPFVSYVVDTDLDDNNGNLQLMFKGLEPWPTSTDVISFKISVHSRSFSLLTSLQRSDTCSLDNEDHDRSLRDTVTVDLKPEQSVSESFSGDREKSQIVDLLSNSSYSTVGFIVGKAQPAVERTNRAGQRLVSQVDKDSGARKSKWELLTNVFASIAQVSECSVRWVAVIDLDGSYPMVGRKLPWASFVLGNDKLVGLKEDGAVFMWASVSGELVAYMDVEKYCDLTPLGHRKIDPDETSSSTRLRKTVSVQADGQSLPNSCSDSITESENGRGQKPPTYCRVFTTVNVTANCLLLAVSDNQGFVFVISMDDYLGSKRSLSSSLPTQSLHSYREDLKNISYWDAGGSDIGGSLPNSLIPNRRFLRSLKLKEDNGRQSGKHAESTAQNSSSGGQYGSGRGARLRSLQIATGFTSRGETARNDAVIVPANQVQRPIRKVFVPFKHSVAVVTVALSVNAITSVVYSPQINAGFTIVQDALRILEGTVDERDFYSHNTGTKLDHSHTRVTCEGEALSFCFQGFLYLVKASSLHVVLPPLESRGHKTFSLCESPTHRPFTGAYVDTQLGHSVVREAQSWPTEVLDRALVCDGLEEAELLCMENGWSLQLFHLRRLQLAVDFVRIEDVERALEALVQVEAAESGVLCVLFAVVELMLNQHYSDSELSQASRLLSSVASFTTRLVRQLGIRGWQECGQQYRQLASKSYLQSLRYKASGALKEFTRFLEVIRTLQICLQDKRRGPNFPKAVTTRDGASFSSDSLNARTKLDTVEEGVEENVDAVDQGLLGEMIKSKSIADSLIHDSGHTGTSGPSSRALVTTGNFLGPGSSRDASPSGGEGGKSRRRSHVESPSDMVARWENENVDASGVVRDSLKSSGRLALAVAQLHRLRMKSGKDDSQRVAVGSVDVFGELLAIGRGIVYELFCKGKTGLAMAALRRLGEDIETALRDLALGAVGRFLHAQAVKELQRLARFSAHDFLLFERLSLIEDNYSNSNFWSTYKFRLQSGRLSDTVGANLKLTFSITAAHNAIEIDCGEVDGVVQGPWTMIEDFKVTEEGYDRHEVHSKGYWAAAGVWLEPWDKIDVDRVLLEARSDQEQALAWEAKLVYYATHLEWAALVYLLESIPSSVRKEGTLLVHLDSEEPFSYPSSAVIDTRENDKRPLTSSLVGGRVLQSIIPKIQVLQLDFAAMCSTLMWDTIEEKLVRRLSFIRVQWKGTLGLMSLFARGGLLFHAYSLGRHKSKDGSHHATISGPSKGVKLHRDAVLGVHEVVVLHCLRHRLPHFLELYVDFHLLALDRGSSAMMQGLVGDCQWALWLLYSAIPRREYDASFANTCTLKKLGPNLWERLDTPADVLTVNDIVEAGGEIIALATLMYAPVPLQKCLCVGPLKAHRAGSWLCSLEKFQSGLRVFPTLWIGISEVCAGQYRQRFSYAEPLKAGRADMLVQYVEWQEDFFSSARAETSLIQMMPRWLPQDMRHLLQLSMQGPAGGVQSVVSKPNEGSVESSPPGSRKSHGGNVELLEALVSFWDATVKHTVDGEIHSASGDTGECSMTCEQYLRRGHAAAAFNILVGARVHTTKDWKSPYGRLHLSEIQTLLSPLTTQEEAILAPIIPLMLMHYESPVVVVACTFLIELCGLSAGLLRIDITALRRLSNYEKSDQTETVFGTVGTGSKAVVSGGAHGGDISGFLAGSLAQEYGHTGVHVLSPSIEPSQILSDCPTILSVQQYLEKASLKDEGMKRIEGGSSGAWLSSGHGDGLLLRTMQWSTSESWSLVTAFCRIHNLPLSTTYLTILARDNDWVGFLAEAQLEGCPLDLLLPLVSKEFSNVRLQSQLLYVLRNLPGASEKSSIATSVEPSSLSATAIHPRGSINADLFRVLADCQESKHPGKALLGKAEEMQWPLLAVVASCFTDVSAESCLTAWLEITVGKESTDINLSDTADAISSRVAAAVDATNAAANNYCTFGVTCSKRPNNKRLHIASEAYIVGSPHLQGPSGQDVYIIGDSLTSEGQSLEQSNGVTTGDSHIRDDEPGESLAALVATLCEQQKFLPLLRAFELFTPTSSFLPFLRFLHAFSQMRISEASAHLAAFAARPKEDGHQRQFLNKSIKNKTSWVPRASIAAADAMHRACPSAYERRCLLQLLSGSDFGDGGVAAMRFRRLYWKIQLAEPALQDEPDPSTEGGSLDDLALFDTLEESNQWEQARSWARQLDPTLSASALFHVTEKQAEAMVTEWKELLWDVAEERVVLWNHCQALFIMHSFPARMAGEFFLKHADAVEPEIPPSEIHNILLLALQWLSGSINNSPPVYPLNLLHELETRVWLLAVESSLERQNEKDSSCVASMHRPRVEGRTDEFSTTFGGVTVNFMDKTADAVAKIDGHLKRFGFGIDETARYSSLEAIPSSSTAGGARSVFKREAGDVTQETKSLDASSVPDNGSADYPHREVQYEETRSLQEFHRGDDSSRVTQARGSGWEASVGEKEVERAVLALLEVGQVAAAKQLQRKFAQNPVPLELSLIEASLHVASFPSSNVSGSVIVSALEPDAVEYIRTSCHLDVTKTSQAELLDCLTDACRVGCGRGVCCRISAIVRVARVLDLNFGDAYFKSSTELLQLLALKGQDTLAEAKSLVATHSIPPANAARILAESFLKGLLAAHRGGFMLSSLKEEGPAPLLWRSSDFIRWAEVCPSEPEIGHALMRLVISGRDMPHACEVELIILAYRYYESSACLDGRDVLVALAATRVDAYVSEGDFSSLSRLITGISNVQALHFILDFLIENGQLKLLLEKRSEMDAAMECSASTRGFRMAVLSALKRFNPHDLDAFAMVYSSFSMSHEMASLLESRGQKSNKQWTNKQYVPEQSEESLEAMRFYVEAAKVYSGVDAGNKTSWCCSQASLISLQLRMPDHSWLNLTDTNARRLLVDQFRFQEALIVAEAYGLNQPAEWVPVIWNQMLVPGERIEPFLNEFVAALPLTHSMLMELARFYRADVSARGDRSQLDFSKWLTPGGIPVEISRHLNKSFRSLLKHTRNMKERLQLATVATGFLDIVDVCLKNIDNMPVTAVPLILRKGHGGTYVPIM